MNYAKIEGHPDLIRDTRTKAIMNTNHNEYESYLAASRSKREEKNKVETMERDLNSIKEEINQVKNLLQELLNCNK